MRPLQTLPKTSYYKMIDWWFMVQMVFIVGIFGFHIFLDKWLQKKKLEMQLESPQQVTEVIKSSGSFVKTLNIGGGNGVAKPKYTANTCPVLKKAKAWNRYASVVTALLFGTFMVIYWTRAMSHYYKKLEFNGGIDVPKD